LLFCWDTLFIKDSSPFLPPEDNDNQNLTNPDDQHRIQEEDDDYIDFEEIDDKD
jgi:hypothetical protein